MHARSSSPFQRQNRPRQRRTLVGSHLFLFALWTLLALTLVSPVQAAKRTLTPTPTTGQSPHKLTPAQVQAIQQTLKKQIQVKHTGKGVTPTKVTGNPPTLRPLSNLPAYNNIGISDPNTRSIASLDGSHHSYSAQVLQDAGLSPGISITSQNITFLWPAVATGTVDNYQAAGQVIPVTAQPGDATVGFLGVSTNGSSSGTATLTYTDGSTSTFTLGLTDWWNGTPAFSNQQVAHVTTINTRHGTKSGNFYLYSATTSLNTSKTLQSVTLPTTVSPGQLHVFAVGVGGPAYNNVGISNDSNTSAGNLDGGGRSYSAQALQSVDLVANQQFDADGIAYAWPDESAGTADDSQANGQVLPIVPVPGATTLGLLGAATGSNGSGTATMTFTDGSTQPFTLVLTNWWSSTPATGNTLVASMSYQNSSSGKSNIAAYLFTAEFAIPSGKTLQSVTLPPTVTGGALHVFAIGTRSLLNNLGTSNNSQPGEGNYDGSGNSWSIQALEAAGIQQGQSFTFNGVTFIWPASYGTLADNSRAVGQTIAVTPTPNATMLAFVGSAAFGSSSGTATLTYTDGSTSTFTLGFTDWWTTTPAYGNLVVHTFSTVNLPSGPRAGSYNLYYAETSLAAGKTLQSVTLPTTLSGGQLHVFALGTRSLYNNIGISDNSNPAGANFDGNGASYSAEDFADPTIAGWNPGDTLTYEGINYIWPGVPAGQADNYQAAGQLIPVTPVAGATTIGFVGAATNAFPSASGTATLTYTDGSTSTFTLGMTDWSMDGGTAIPLASDRLFALLPHYNNAQGTITGNSYLFETETRLTAGKTLQSVTLPSSVNQGQLHVFMIGTRAGENYPNNLGTSDDSDTVFANFDGGGNSYSIEALESAGLYEGQPFPSNGVTFTWPASYSVIPENYQAAGQIIPVTPVTGATTLAFLGAATNGGSTSSGTATITYTDSSTQTFTLTLTNWWNATAQGGNVIAATCSYLNNATGQQTQTVNLYYTSVTLQTGKTLQSVTLPTTVSGGQLHVFAIGTK
jgi:hypothetical protein